jgi:hypothetical protein
VRWEEIARAESYDVEAREPGSQAEFAVVATVRDPAADLAFPPGSRVEVRVVAKNAAGASAPSEPVEAQVPAAAAA